MRKQQEAKLVLEQAGGGGGETPQPGPGQGDGGSGGKLLGSPRNQCPEDTRKKSHGVRGKRAPSTGRDSSN